MSDCALVHLAVPWSWLVSFLLADANQLPFKSSDCSPVQFSSPWAVLECISNTLACARCSCVWSMDTSQSADIPGSYPRLSHQSVLLCALCCNWILYFHLLHHLHHIWMLVGSSGCFLCRWSTVPVCLGLSLFEHWSPMSQGTPVTVSEGTPAVPQPLPGFCNCPLMPVPATWGLWLLTSFRNRYSAFWMFSLPLAVTWSLRLLSNTRCIFRAHFAVS